ncbi:MAG: amidohydrolase [Alphaproteobacteria bacterium]|nr:amidohydrolase [Alphaproteobacteria bacterium]
MKHGMRVFDGDGHVLEDDQELARYYEGSHKGLRMFKPWSIFPSLDGWARGFAIGNEDKGRKYTYTDAKIWGEVLDQMGLEGSVLYPTAGLAFGLITDTEWANATAVAYNNWLEDVYTAKDKRLFGAGLVPVHDPEFARKEIRRCAKERVRFPTMLMPSVTNIGKTFGDKFFWPIYEECEKQNIPIALHGAPSRGFGFDHFREFARVHALEHPIPLMIQLTDMIFGGVFDDFPKLRVAYLEGGCAWVPFMMDRLDYEYESIFGTKARRRMKKKPSDYMREGDNFWVAMELGERSIKYTIDAMGSDRILYASDYPHEPTEEDLTAELPEFIESKDYSQAIKDNLLYKNQKRFYGLN